MKRITKSMHKTTVIPAVGGAVVDPPNQRHLVRAPRDLAVVRAAPLAATVFATRIGCFEKARVHRVERPGGIGPLALLCLEGEGWVEVAGKRHRVQAGEAAWVDCQRPHTYGSDPDVPWSIAWTHVAGRQVGDWEKQLTQAGRRRVWRVGEAGAAQAAFEQLWRLLADGDTSLRGSVACAGWLTALDSPRRAAGAAAAESPIDRVARRLREDCTTSVSLETLAREAGYSPSHLLAQFRARWGCPPRHYQIRVRLQRACHLLETTTWKISAVASEVGYENPFYFSRLFSATFRLSPVEYRARFSSRPAD